MQLISCCCCCLAVCDIPVFVYYIPAVCIDLYMCLCVEMYVFIHIHLYTFPLTEPRVCVPAKSLQSCPTLCDPVD